MRDPVPPTTVPLASLTCGEDEKPGLARLLTLTITSRNELAI